ncbi:MAG: uracil phosphoribosyltransferase, partial [Halovenus sp.]
MSIEQREQTSVVTHALAQHTLTDLRSVDTEQVAFRKGLVKLGRLCGYEIIDEWLESAPTEVQTPLTSTTGDRLTGLDDVVIVNVLRAATPFVEGLLKAFPAARQAVISASRDESAGMNEEGEFPISVQYVKLPEIRPEDTVIVADPMLATGSTLSAVLAELLADNPEPKQVIVLSAVSAPAGLARIDSEFPAAKLVTVSVDDHLDDDGYIVP